jgi:hypothetical protein
MEKHELAIAVDQLLNTTRLGVIDIEALASETTMTVIR